MTKAEYAEYEAKVAAFVKEEKLQSTHGGECTDEFSIRACECCRSRLGGQRFEMIGFKKGVGVKAVEYSVCDDCNYYAEYGQLDDMTMADMEV